MSASKYYEVDPEDPDAPVVVDEYNGIRAGDQVRYVGPVPLDGPLIVSELIYWSEDDLYHAILNRGEYECDADNLSLLVWQEHM